jgi:CheY-like chemotaxis protein
MRIGDKDAPGATGTSASGVQRRLRMNAKPRVVVINDTEEILELFDDILSEMGCEVVLMSYAPDDLRRIENEKPDLVVIDFVLGGREFMGWQLLQKLRMNRDTQEVPIIACTAAAQQVREQEGYLLEQGISVVLKPFNVEQLEGAVRKALPQLASGDSG